MYVNNFTLKHIKHKSKLYIGRKKNSSLFSFYNITYLSLLIYVHIFQFIIFSHISDDWILKSRNFIVEGL